MVPPLADLTWLANFWPHLTAAVALMASIGCAGHVVLHKRDTRAAIGWMGVIWLAPIVGSTLYVLFGINRISRRAHFLRRQSMGSKVREPAGISPIVCETGDGAAGQLRTLEHVVSGITGRPVVPGNCITPLVDGDQAYPAMLEAIDAAQKSICLSTYIFNNDATGRLFCAAFGRAVQRGVEVRVIIDAIGARYTFPSIVRSLHASGARVERFLRTFLPGWFPYANLRNHRKIMVVDGQLGFTGGINIRDGCWLAHRSSHAVHDLHFRLAGPIVGQLQEVFADDWLFLTQERMDGQRWFPSIESAGNLSARGISDGPDEDLDKLRLTLCGAIACAQQSIAICTPYFLPDESLVSALNVAAMRGVAVDILLPERNNLTLVQWASTAMLWQVLERGCRVWLSPPPFDHSKLMIVDGLWTLLGSGNWDPRSLRLNFEFNVECYGAELATPLRDWFHERLKKSRAVTLADVDSRSLPIRLRDGVARLLTPYL